MCRNGERTPVRAIACRARSMLMSESARSPRSSSIAPRSSCTSMRVRGEWLSPSSSQSPSARSAPRRSPCCSAIRAMNRSGQRAWCSCGLSVDRIANASSPRSMRAQDVGAQQVADVHADAGRLPFAKSLVRPVQQVERLDRLLRQRLRVRGDDGRRTAPSRCGRGRDHGVDQVGRRLGVVAVGGDEDLGGVDRRGESAAHDVVGAPTPRDLGDQPVGRREVAHASSRRGRGSTRHSMCSERVRCAAERPCAYSRWWRALVEVPEVQLDDAELERMAGGVPHEARSAGVRPPASGALRRAWRRRRRAGPGCAAPPRGRSARRSCRRRGSGPWTPAIALLGGTEVRERGRAARRPGRAVARAERGGDHDVVVPELLGERR